MKNKIKIIICIAAICNLQYSISNAQTLSPKVTPTSGGYFTGGGKSLSWTMGETYNTTLSSANNKLTQGFQQPEVNPIIIAMLNLEMFIQGYYVGGGMMSPVLLNEGADLNPNSTNVDTVTVSLVNPADGNFIKTTKGVLQTDGSMSVSFPGAGVFNNSYYIYIQHRNSIETSSASPVAIASTTSYDFSSDASQSFGNNMAEVEPGIWAIYTGDMNQDGYIDPFDFPPYDMDNSNQLTGVYEDDQGFSTDLNGDGYVDPFDFPVYDGNNSNQVTASVPW